MGVVATTASHTEGSGSGHGDQATVDTVFGRGSGAEPQPPEAPPEAKIFWAFYCSPTQIYTKLLEIVDASTMHHPSVIDILYTYIIQTMYKPCT